MERKVYTCDGCGREKDDGNGWWIAGKLELSFYVAPWIDGGNIHMVQHYCGQACVIKALAAFMGEK